MAKKKTTRRKGNRNKRKSARKQRKNTLMKRLIVLGILMVALLVAGWYIKDKVHYYYAKYFNTFVHKKLKNTASEAQRIERIIDEHNDKVFGLDISHYQNPEDISWDSLSIANRSIPLRFVVMRATMGKNGKDKHFQKYWEIAKKHNLTRGAYHFYRADEDPVTQANNFLQSVKLESGDLLPVLDIEKAPRRISNSELISNLKTWLKIVEEAYGQKPIIYTYYYYHRDNLGGAFEDYPIWLANYNDVLEPSPELKDWAMWQFTENGIAYGINTKVDLNVYNGGWWSFDRLTLK